MTRTSLCEFGWDDPALVYDKLTIQVELLVSAADVDMNWRVILATQAGVLIHGIEHVASKGDHDGPV